jgi:hypothetical protein
MPFFDLVTVFVFTSVAAYAVWLWYRPRLVAQVMAETTRICHQQFVTALQQQALESLAQLASSPPPGEPNETVN